ESAAASRSGTRQSCTGNGRDAANHHEFGDKTVIEPDQAAEIASPAAAAGPGVLKWPSSLMSSNRTDMRFETPASSIVTPYSTSAPVIVRLWWVMTMNCVHCWNSLIIPR